jgi:polysaccharide biosynthesis protein PslG
VRRLDGPRGFGQPARWAAGRPRSRAWPWSTLVVLVLALGLTQALDRSPAEGALRAVPARFWGVIPADNPTATDFRKMDRGGVDSVRFLMAWDQINSSPGKYNFGYFDDIVRGAARRGIEVIPVLYGSPGWVASEANRLPVSSGAQKRAWKSFVKQVLRRYGRRGRFWAQNRGIPKRPFHFLQIWNEQDLKLYSHQPSPRKYAALLNISHQATKQVDRRAKLVLGGMLGDPFASPPNAYSAAQFLSRLYRFKGTRNDWVAVALHPYVAFAKSLKPQLDGLRRVLRRHHDGRKQIWITEIGWSSEPRPHPPPRYDDLMRGLRGQARQLQLAFRFIKRHWTNYNLRRVFWYSFRDGATVEGCSFCDSVGLLYRNYKPKPAWNRFVGFAR